jgi:hypothetical protein
MEEFFITISHVFERQDLVSVKISKEQVVEYFDLEKDENWQGYVFEFLNENPELLDEAEKIEDGKPTLIEHCDPEVIDVNWL